MSDGNETRTRVGDQALPTGRQLLHDDQQLVIHDITARRQVGIDRYGQGHYPFNGRSTILDVYEEQLDFLVYLRSLLRMAEAGEERLTEVLLAELEQWPGKSNEEFARQLARRVQGYVVGQLMVQGGGES